MAFSWSRAFTWVIALVAGGAYGIAGTIAHAYVVGPIPVGLIVSIVGAGALLAAVRLLTRDRWAALACAIGLLVATLVFSGAGPGGSVIVPSGKLDMLGPLNLGVVWTFTVPLLGALAVAWPDVSRNRTSAGN